MQQQKQTSGMTFLGFLILLVVLGFFAFIIMRLFPPYAEHYSVRQAMQEIADEPGIAQKTPDQIKNAMERKLFVNYVNLDKDLMKLERGDRGYTFTIKYESRGDVIGNLDYVVTFDNTVVLGPVQM